MAVSAHARRLPKVVRLDSLTASQRQLVNALIEAQRNAQKNRDHPFFDGVRVHFNR